MQLQTIAVRATLLRVFREHAVLPGLQLQRLSQQPQKRGTFMKMENARQTAILTILEKNQNAFQNKLLYN